MAGLHIPLRGMGAVGESDGAGMTADAVGRLVWKWQKRLHLDVWEISIITVEDVTINDEGHWADVQRRKDSYDAIITIATQQPCERLERTVIHELLHLMLTAKWELSECVYAQIPRRLRKMLQDEERVGEELAVNALARVLMEAYSA